MAFPKRKGDSNMKDNNTVKSREEKILNFLLEIDRIHEENNGEFTFDELKLRIAISINLNLWSILNKLKLIRKFLSKFKDKFW